MIINYEIERVGNLIVHSGYVQGIFKIFVTAEDVKMTNVIEMFFEN